MSERKKRWDHFTDGSPSDMSYLYLNVNTSQVTTPKELCMVSGLVAVGDMTVAQREEAHSDSGTEGGRGLTVTVAQREGAHSDSGTEGGRRLTVTAVQREEAHSDSGTEGGGSQ